MNARFHERLDEISAAAWDALGAHANPFTAHAFLAGLEQTGCIDRHAGWQAHHLGLYEGDTLVAAAPLYLKGNSHGEFVFDRSWAGAYARHGLDYYPKLLGAVPYSPVTGPRLLAGAGDGVQGRCAALVGAITQEVERLGLSSAHVNFVDDIDTAILDDLDWLPRFDWQFHWHNRGWPDFEAFLGALTAKKRKNIRHERAQVARAGITCEVRHGDELDDADWRALHRLYLATFDAHGNHAALTSAFFRHLGVAMPRQVVAILCRRGGALVAMALCLRGHDTLYGRYWGASEHVPGLHFEACYYQGIDYCLRHGLARFEPGAQGEHKIARGFLPVRTRSFHFIADPRFRAAIADALRREAVALERYHDDLLAHSPYAGRDEAA
ncbi:GNAT family N-acetyltransferase [Dokdonella sp.]|uniref:GNAT family N-acetyltransferase n=1 Tax=Dokdonella sp. TaxID=2291710 RepID=UPI0025B945FA|nr:GNAT family N-acetyltransferase [Dokdonella sp.]MBX3692569.1 N-acetyltransferase [Dokdonella sp.]MCW5568566.1 N-acetyltransferase [Dokdonella sp.]